MDLLANVFLPRITALLPLPWFVSSAIYTLVRLYCGIILIWALLSWVSLREGWLRNLYNALDVLVDPYVSLFRRFIPPVANMDLSPMLAIIVLELLVRYLI